MQFYRNVYAVSPARHREWSIKPDGGYAFARSASALPLMTAEFATAAAYLPIVFAVQGETVAPVVAVGARQDESLLVAQDGRWDGAYLPASLRRYPFAFSISADGANLTLCLDEAYEGFDREGREGERLFSKDGARTPHLDWIVEFVASCQREQNASMAFGRRLLELNILEPANATLTHNGQTLATVTGFHRVSRDALGALKDSQLAALEREKALELIHIHWWSLDRFADLAQRLGRQMAAAKPD